MELIAFCNIHCILYGDDCVKRAFRYKKAQQENMSCRALRSGALMRSDPKNCGRFLHR